MGPGRTSWCGLCSWETSLEYQGGIRSGANELYPRFLPKLQSSVKGLRLPRIRPEVLTLSFYEVGQKGEQGRVRTPRCQEWGGGSWPLAWSSRWSGPRRPARSPAAPGQSSSPQAPAGKFGEGRRDLVSFDASRIKDAPVSVALPGLTPCCTRIWVCALIERMGQKEAWKLPPVLPWEP